MANTTQSWGYAEIQRYLLDMQPAATFPGHRPWVEGCLPRFLRTLELVPPGAPAQHCLEIGAMPYTFTMLMKKFRPYELTLVDFDAAPGRSRDDTVELPGYGERHALHSHRFDVEREDLPFDDASFDGALCCEVLEHLTADPIQMLANLHRTLKPNGWLVLTTPNVANLQNVFALLHGRNIYKPYERVFGPTWRHNREYTSREVVDLLTSSGFVVEHVSVEDPLPPGKRLPLALRLAQRLARLRYGEQYGEQIYVRARRGPQFHRVYPSWLFEHTELHDALQGASAVSIGQGGRR